MMVEIDSWMRHISWDVVKKEYENGRILEESNLHFSTTMSGEGKKNPRVDLAVVFWIGITRNKRGTLYECRTF
jgi:hypothetical protein